MDPDRINMDEEEFSEAARLHPENISFPGKEMLRKTPADLSDTHIEYLSVASLENDLTPEQRLELEANLRENASHMAVFNAIQKTRLKPFHSTYKNKSSLKKLTAGQKAFRIVTSGISIAAAIAILVVSYIFIPDHAVEKDILLASETISESVPSSIIIEAGNPIKIISEEKRSAVTILVAKQNIAFPSAVPDTAPAAAIIEYQTMPLAYIPASPAIRYPAPDLMLLASNNNVPPAEFYEERGRLRRLIASTFREKVLGDENYSDERIKAIEIAIAGVDGINRLLDWNMELRETVDNTGEVKSVYFSSALITFNSPVRKTSE